MLPANHIDLALGQNAVLGTVGTSNTNISPIVAWILLMLAIDIKDPLPVGRPLSSEIKMSGLSGNHECDWLHRYITCRDLISLRARQMKGNSLSVGTKAQAVRKTFLPLS